MLGTFLTDGNYADTKDVMHLAVECNSRVAHAQHLGALRAFMLFTKCTQMKSTSHHNSVEKHNGESLSKILASSTVPRTKPEEYKM